jgi:hypothetical protein
LFGTDEVTTRWITTTTGQRYVQLSSDAFRDPAPIVIYDFNPYHIFDDDEEDDSNYSVQTWSEIRGDEEGGPFDEDVWCGLPFRVIKSSEMYDYDAVLLDEERIIGMRVCSYLWRPNLNGC